MLRKKSWNPFMYSNVKCLVILAIKYTKILLVIWVLLEIKNTELEVIIYNCHNLFFFRNKNLPFLRFYRLIIILCLFKKFDLLQKEIERLYKHKQNLHYFQNDSDWAYTNDIYRFEPIFLRFKIGGSSIKCLHSSKKKEEACALYIFQGNEPKVKNLYGLL